MQNMKIFMYAYAEDFCGLVRHDIIEL